MDTTILVIIITRKAEFRNLHRRFEELNYGIFSGLPPFAPNNKTKALISERKPYCQNESLSNRFVMHPKRKVGASFVYGLSVGFWGEREGDGTGL